MRAVDVCLVPLDCRSVPATVAYSCPAPYSVSVVSVFPPVITRKVDGQRLQITLAIGGNNASIPVGLLDAPGFSDGSAISIVITPVNGSGSATCVNPIVTNYDLGQMVCTVSGATSLPIGNCNVVVTVNGVSSGQCAA